MSGKLIKRVAVLDMHDYICDKSAGELLSRCVGIALPRVLKNNVLVCLQYTLICLVGLVRYTVNR